MKRKKKKTNKPKSAIIKKSIIRNKRSKLMGLDHKFIFNLTQRIEKHAYEIPYTREGDDFFADIKLLLERYDGYTNETYKYNHWIHTDFIVKHELKRDEYMFIMQYLSKLLMQSDRMDNQIPARILYAMDSVGDLRYFDEIVGMAYKYKGYSDHVVLNALHAADSIIFYNGYSKLPKYLLIYYIKTLLECCIEVRKFIKDSTTLMETNDLIEWHEERLKELQPKKGKDKDKS